MATENHIFIIGAFDRFNYGDLLFPLVIEAQLATYGQSFDTRYFGIIESDLSALGGKPTDNITAFYRACSQSMGHTSIIVAGGEAVAVTWSSLLLALSRSFKRTHRFHHYLNKVIDLNAFARRRLHGETELPFVFTASDFTGVDRVIFNSLGGSEIDQTIFNRYRGLGDKLRGVDYFAVRDKATQQHLAEQGIQTQLYPDSAILMSNFYPKALLVERVTPEIAEYVAENLHRYIFFQVKNNHAKTNEQCIAKQLDAIASQTGLHICLCPIGKALNHDDHLALKRIAPLLTQPTYLVEKVTIWDIMYLIANARVYVGTSLHGAITAMSYAVPYVGVAVPKLHSYLQAWGVDNINHTVTLSEIYEGVNRALAVGQLVLQRSRDEQLNAAEASFSHIRQLVFS